MSALDICYMPSEKEGLGLVAVECQANNLTVAVSNGFPEDVFVSDLIFRLENYEIKDEELPKDINMPIGIPDFITIWALRAIYFISFIMLLLGFMMI